MNTVFNWQAQQESWRILGVRLDNFGDVLMTTPAFRALKETFRAVI